MRSRRIFIFLFLAMIAGVYFYIEKRNVQPTDKIILYGNVDIRQVDLGFRVFGRVQKLFVDEGDRVKPGDLIAILDKTPYELAVARSHATVASLEADLENALYKLERRDGLAPIALSDEEYDDALFQAESLASNLDEARAALAENIVSVEDTFLHAPSSGTILTRVKEPGSIVNTTDTIFTLSLDAPVWIRAYVNEIQLGKIYPGMKAEITTDAYPNEIISGWIGFISPVAEFTPKNVETTDLRTELVYRLRIIVDNPPKTLRQGMPVTCVLPLHNEKK